MLPRTDYLLRLIVICAIIWSGMSPALAQNSAAFFHQTLREKAALAETDFAALGQGETVVRLLPVKNKREVAVYGLVGVQVPAEVFLQSFRESMTRKSNPAILEIGGFSDTPTLADLRDLTFESKDLADLKECVVGDCKLKLSAAMIERLRREVNWEAPDYSVQATQLLKIMLVDYVRDYLARKDAALIEYSDKSKQVRMVEEQSDLAASSYLSDIFPEFQQYLKRDAKSDESLAANAIVWSKIKFGLKPVLAINHIRVFRRAQETGPQVLVASKQIYANHYFDSSLALTAFVEVPGATSQSYLIYENRSRADGLEGMFSKIKRGIVEEKAVKSLKTILESSKANLNARASGGPELELTPVEGRTWKQWMTGRTQMFVWFFLITALAGLFMLRNYNWKGSLAGRAHH